MPNLKQAQFTIGHAYGAGTSFRRVLSFNSYWRGDQFVPTAQTTTIINHAITVRNWHMRLATAPGSGVTRTWTLWKNGSSTALTIAVSGTNTTGSDTSNSVSFSAGDTAFVEEVVTGGTPADPGIVNGVWEIENPDQYTSIYGFGSHTLITGGPLYCDIPGSNWDNASSSVGAVNSIDGTLTGYSVFLSAAPGSLGSGRFRTFIIHKNGTAQDGTGGTPDTTITVNETSSTGSTTFSLTVAPTDRIRVVMTSSASVAAASLNGTMTLVADSPGMWSLGMSSVGNGPSVSATEYAIAVGGSPSLGWTGTEADVEAIGPPTSIAPLLLSGMYVFMDGTPGVGKSYTYTLRKNSTDTAQTVTVSGTSVDGTTSGGTVSFDRADLVSLKAVPSGTPTSRRVRMAFWVVDPAAAGLSISLSEIIKVADSMLTVVRMDITGANQYLMVSP